MRQAIVELFESGSLQCSSTLDLPVSVGRQDPAASEPLQGEANSRNEGSRFVVAPVSERSIPRYFFRIESDGEDNLRISNTHTQLALRIERDIVLHGNENHVFSSKQEIMLPGGRSLHVSPATQSHLDTDPFRSLCSQPLDPASLAVGADRPFDRTLAPVGKANGEEGEYVVELLQQVLPVIRESASSDAFFRVAASAALKIAGLNRVTVILFPKTGQQVKAEVFSENPQTQGSSNPGLSAPRVSSSMLASVQAECITKIHDAATANLLDGESLQSLHQAVAAPILNKDRSVIGILYGDRWLADSLDPITDVEAKLVEILASAISAGIARQNEEQKKVSMAGYFSDAVAKHIAEDQSLLQPKEENVSVLFCDVRKFSTISKALGATKTVEWMQDVFTMLTECVEREEGIVMNYVGDELIAMWGAPDAQADHAGRAIKSAIAMLQGIQTIERTWSASVDIPLKVGIGINSGLAAVGNTGSRVKFQYGAFGNVVNIASRLQSATKQFGVDCLISDSTFGQAKPKDISCRELSTIQVVGISESIIVHQVLEDIPQNWSKLKQQYEAALDDYQSMRFADATQRLGMLLQEFPSDEPSMRLLGLSVSQLRQPNKDFSPVDSLTWK